MIGDQTLHRGIQSQCFKANYTYFISSMEVSQTEGDLYVDMILSFFGWYDFTSELLAVEAEDDLQDLSLFKQCLYNNLP